jgi:hypothetical protein
VKRTAYNILVENPVRKRSLGRPRYRCMQNIKMDLREIELGRMDWTDLVQDRDRWRVILNTVMNPRVP